MANIASITIKKFDGTTDIVYDGIVGFGGPNDPALWRQDTGAAAALPIGMRATLTLGGKWNGPRTARQVPFTFAYPYATQNSTTTLYSADNKALFQGIATLPVAIPMNVLNEAGYQFGNLMAAALIKSSLASGFPPT